MKQTQNYLKLNNKYLKEAEALMSGGDYVQASEKFWGTAAEIVKAVAGKRGIEIKSHGELYGFVAKLKDELHEPELARLFSLVSTLHQNFYEDWLPAETVKDHAEAVRRLVERLKKETG
jgi:PaREP1/PaREP8 domain containing family protein